jgi:ATP-dependent RNA helicase MSS116
MVKVMIFFNTSMFAEFAFNYLQAAGCTNVEMKSRWCSNMDMLHTRMGNGAANRSEKEFASCMDCFLLTSNVTARGMDFPSVTTVIQVGASPPELYTQRVGRQR